jgi:signal transduction histidine kinase
VTFVMPTGGPCAPNAPVYSGAMERIADKALMLAACLGVVAVAGDAGPVAVVAVALAVCVSAGVELALPSRPGVAIATCCVATLLSAVVPGAFVALPLVSYDLGRTQWRVTWALAPVAAAWAWLMQEPRQAVAAALLLSCCSVALSLRCGCQIELAGKATRLQDDLQDKLLALGEKNQELEEAREYEAHTAALAERTRIAREIHDSVGHLLTRLVLQVEALKVVHRGDAAVTDELTQVSDGLNEALRTMRASVHSLDDSGVDLGVELNRLAATSGIPGVQVECDPHGNPPAEVSRCLVAVAREALTNAVRHAHAKSATVRMNGMPGIWQLRVWNDGEVPGTASGLEGRGMGLRTMRERVESLGGTLSVSVGNGFEVFASLPRREHS